MRIEGWEARLIEYIDQSNAKPFAWGSHDCIIWSGKWVAMVTGSDHIAEWIGRYKTESGALRVLKRLGYSSPADAVSGRLPSRPVLMARRGDLVLHEQNSIGICTGIKSYFLTEQGITAAPTGECIRAWTVD